MEIGFDKGNVAVISEREVVDGMREIIEFCPVLQKKGLANVDHPVRADMEITRDL